MASITTRKNKDGSTSYLIRVFVDETRDGKQKVQSMTWHPDPALTPRQVEKELARQVILFEDQAKNGVSFCDGSTRFEEYAKVWMESAQLAPKTRERYEDMLERILPAIGHIRLSKLQAQHLEAFYKNLAEAGTSKRGQYATSTRLSEVRREKKLSLEELGRLAGVSTVTVGTACRGQHVSIETAKRIAEALEVKTESLFELHAGAAGLNSKTIHHHHALICAILAKAKKSRIIPYNVAQEFTEAPKVQKKEPRFLDDKQAQAFLHAALEEPDIRVKTMITLLLFTGARRGELCGLSWPDLDRDKQLLSITKASQYQRGKGIVEVPTKNSGSVRAVRVPPFVFDLLDKYRTWWLEQKLVNGDQWKGDELQRLFIQADGRPINPDTANYWLEKFVAKNGLPSIPPHGLRHTFATLQIAAGVDIRTLQQRGGWSQASTPMNIYAHAIKSAEEAATEAMESILLPSKQPKIG